MTAITDIETFVLLFPNDEWSDTGSDSTVAQLRPNISFAQHAQKNFETLSTRGADHDGTISGFLYVPDLNEDDGCNDVSRKYVPANVTRQANLPPTDYTLIAIAPWININCTFSYMAAARSDPVRALLFYQVGNETDTTTPASSSPAWDLDDGGAWRSNYRIPIYGIPGAMGFSLMQQLSLYSGNMTEVPHGHDLTEIPGVDPRDYVRLYTEIGLSTQSFLPTLWVYFLVVFAVLVLCLGGTSALMHYVQRAHRRSLRRRVANGEVDLEALGIKRLKIPRADIERLPLFTYVSEDEMSPLKSSLEADHFVTTMEQHDVAQGSSIGPDSQAELQYSISASNELPNQELIAINDKTPQPPAVLVHKFLPYSQPTCAICLEDFESRVSEIRELPCGHIFHPDCIDTFLANTSSLCPMCKKSALPLGCCPTRITNAMVRRERNLRRIRTVRDEAEDLEASGARRRIQELKANLRRTLLNSSSARDATSPLPLQPQPVFVVTSFPGVSHRGVFSVELSRQQMVEHRIRELEAGQVPIQDPELLRDRQRPKWRKTLSNAFPGF
ncbi:unnamed protein product [Diplocarpon coronariae]|uniref:RING-type domain-containing protein n=1 Tax=Diplocarpon coronariae TaxID=2795749 RepID=A0A218YUR6_9HELO|nr:hypothetical protein B2J93_7114 [Marssonina coronariae]